MLSERHMFESARYLVGFFHPGTERPDSGQHHDVSRPDAIVFNGSDGRFFTHKNPRRPLLAVDTVRVEDGLINRGAFYHRSFGREVAAWKSQGAGEPLLASAG